jgi:hypothetical protein
MISLKDAQLIAEGQIKKMQTTCTVELSINHGLTEEYDTGFVFFYNSKRYWATNDFIDTLAGNGPLFVNKETGMVTVLPSNKAVEKSVREMGL